MRIENCKLKIGGRRCAALLAICIFQFSIFNFQSLGAEPFSAEGITVVDGDTIKVAKLHLGWGVALVDQTIRAADFDAWESSKARQSVDVTDAEVQKGKRAAAVLAQLMRDKYVRFEPHMGRNRDVYGRLLAVWSFVDTDGRWRLVSEFMDAGGHIRK